MADKEVVRDRQLTVKDLVCIKLFLPTLIAAAKNNRTMTYKEIVQQTGSPGGPRNVGRRLTWLRFFTRPRELPDLDSLVIKTRTRTVGDGFEGDAKQQQIACFNCVDWRMDEVDSYFEEMEKFQKGRYTLERMERFFNLRILS